MKLKADSKFEIGDILQVKGATTRLVVNNVMAEVCSGGTQILYRGLLLAKTANFGKGYVAEKGMSINESVLEKAKIDEKMEG